MTNEKFSYFDYVKDEKFIESYNDYQARYAEQIRESDKVIISMITEIVERSGGGPLRVLDIGCSTGNLLLHLKNMVPGPEYVGGDLAESSLKACSENPSLGGIAFHKMDVLKLDGTERYDIIIANAVAVYFTWEEYRRCLKSVANALTPGGSYIAFEWVHPFDCQDLTIYETSIGHPEGIRICFRPMRRVHEEATAAGFAELSFH
ncbi:MAG: class I SAM-dependent methyltransferase, partial [Nitratireductor sp.]